MNESNGINASVHERMQVMLSGQGLIKRIPAAVFRAQHRYSKGIKGMGTSEVDAVKSLVTADTQDELVLFTDTGKMFHLKCHELFLDSSRTGRGVAIKNLISVAEGDRVIVILPLNSLRHEHCLLMGTAKGKVKNSSLNILTIPSSGVTIMDIETGDELVTAELADETDDVVLVTTGGRSIRFTVKSLRNNSRTGGGIRGISLKENDKLVSISVVKPDNYLLVVTENGYGKLTATEDYKTQSRGGVGTRTLKVTEKTGWVAAAKLVSLTQQIMLISKNGVIISTPLKDEDGIVLPILGRSGHGVMFTKMGGSDSIGSVAVWD